MNAKQVILVVVVVAIAVAAYVLLRPEPEADKTRGVSRQGTPTQWANAAGIQDGQWPKVPLNAQMTVLQALDQIQAMAKADTGLTQAQLVNLNDVLLWGCARNTMPYGAAMATHVASVQAALTSAQGRQWSACIEQMGHGH